MSGLAAKPSTTSNAGRSNWALREYPPPLRPGGCVLPIKKKRLAWHKPMEG